MHPIPRMVERRQLVGGPDTSCGECAGGTSNVVPLRRAEGGGTRVVAVTSGKGGVGKSVISASLGLSFASMGRRVCMIDADLALANLDLMLGVRAEKTLEHVMKQQASVQEVLVDGPAGVSLLPACTGRAEFTRLAETARMGLLSQIDLLEQQFDTLVIDTGAGIGSNAVGFATAAQQVLVVVTPDPTSIADAYATIKVLSQRGVSRFNLAVNMASSTQEAERVIARMLGLVDRFLDVLVVPVGFVCRDDAVGKSVRACQPLVKAYPQSAAACAIRGIAARLLGEPQELRAAGPLLFWKRLMGVEATWSAGDEESER